MTVKEFKKLVSKIPESQDDWVVICSSDSEGNSFREIGTVSHDEDDRCSQYYDWPSNELFQWDEDEVENFEEFEEQVKEYPHLTPCIVLW